MTSAFGGLRSTMGFNFKSVARLLRCLAQPNFSETGVMSHSLPKFHESLCPAGDRISANQSAAFQFTVTSHSPSSLSSA